MAALVQRSWSWSGAGKIAGDMMAWLAFLWGLRRSRYLSGSLPNRKKPTRKGRPRKSG
jgi:hypothetical protein